METFAANSGVQPRELPVIAGHLALDFANTIDDPGGGARWDHLSSYDDLLTWSVRVGRLDTDLRDHLAASADKHPLQAAVAHRRAFELRTALNEVFGAIAGGHEPHLGDWSALRARAADGLQRAELARSGPAYELCWNDPRDLEIMLWPVVDEAVRLLGSPELARLKRCAGCPWLFLDRSKNGSRRWCAMNDCGTHEKIQRYVSRRAARRPS